MAIERLWVGLAVGFFGTPIGPKRIEFDALRAGCWSPLRRSDLNVYLDLQFFGMYKYAWII